MTKYYLFTSVDVDAHPSKGLSTGSPVLHNNDQMKYTRRCTRQSVWTFGSFSDYNWTA